MQAENTSNQYLEKRIRSTPSQPETWKRNVYKKLRMSGKEYINRGGIRVEKRNLCMYETKQRNQLLPDLVFVSVTNFSFTCVRIMWHIRRTEQTQNICTALINALKVIVLKFMEKGHSYLESESSAIKHQKMYSTIDWAVLVGAADSKMISKISKRRLLKVARENWMKNFLIATRL